MGTADRISRTRSSEIASLTRKKAARKHPATCPQLMFRQARVAVHRYDVAYQSYGAANLYILRVWEACGSREQRAAHRRARSLALHTCPGSRSRWSTAGWQLPWDSCRLKLTCSSTCLAAGKGYCARIKALESCSRRPGTPQRNKQAAALEA